MTDLAEQDRLFRELGDSPLRDEMFPELAAQERARHAADAQAAAVLEASPGYPLEFTGNGSEYFRIWIVNLLLTVATLGIYSAWAKVRKTRYFWLNTRLAGHVFDYHGAPVAILRGRIVALVLLAAYTWALGISRTAGLITIGVLCAIGPWLFWKAQQFKFRNSSHRGLRFDFDSGFRDTYVSLLPLLLIWLSGSVAGLVVAQEGWLAASIGLVTAVLFPWMHHRLKSYQHARARYGDQRASFEAATSTFYWVYAKGIFMIIGAGLLALFIGLAAGALGQVWLRSAQDPEINHKIGLAVGLLVVGTLYLTVWPYYAARLQRVVWDNTRLGPLRFRTTMASFPLFRLALACTFWTLLTLGLYWPFAAVRLARYRVQSMQVLSDRPLDEIARGVNPSVAPAAGDGAVDLFGLDVGL